MDQHPRVFWKPVGLFRLRLRWRKRQLVAFEVHVDVNGSLKALETLLTVRQGEARRGQVRSGQVSCAAL